MDYIVIGFLMNKYKYDMKRYHAGQILASVVQKLPEMMRGLGLGGKS